jgi:hypothetical protein
MDPIMKTYVFDLDEVIASFNVDLCKVLAEILGDPSVLDDHKSWDEYELAGFYPQIENFQAIFLHMLHTGVIANLPAKPSTVALIKAIRARGDRVAVMTARGWIPDRAVTELWFEEAGVVIDELIITPPKASKADYIPDETWIYIDDNLDHALACAHKCQAVIILNKPWNQTRDRTLPDNVFRLVDPDDIGIIVSDGELWLTQIEKVVI